VDKLDSIYHWDKDFFEKKLSLLTNCQLGFVGAALMLMMMNRFESTIVNFRATAKARYILHMNQMVVQTVGTI